MYWRIIWHLQSKHSCCNNTITRRTTESFHLLEKMNFSLAIWQQFLDKPSLYKGFSFPRKNIISILEDNSARLQFSYVAESLKRSMYFPATQQPGTRSPKNIPIASKISSFATSASLSKPTIFHETSTLQPRSPFLSLSLSLSNAHTHTHSFSLSASLANKSFSTPQPCALPQENMNIPPEIRSENSQIIFVERECCQ